MAYRILFVGGGDCGREIMAKAIMDDRIKTGNIEGIEVKARGLVVLFPEPVNSKVAYILENNEIPMEYDCAFQLEQSDIDDSDVIITMDENQKERVKSTFQNISIIYTLKELAGEEGTILDPYGKELMDYEYCFRELARLVDRVLESKIQAKQ